MESRSKIKVLQTYKDKVETGLEECEKISKNLLYNYITDIEEQEKEGEKHFKYEEDVIFVVAAVDEYIKEEEENVAISNREKWQVKPVAGEKETETYLLDREEDLLQNAQSLAISQEEISVQDQQRQKESYSDD